MKYLIITFFVLAMTGCGVTRSMKDIRDYGEERFITEVLAVADGQAPSPALISKFRPLRIEPHLNGAWLVYRESGRYEEGIYVDKVSVDDWGGSGMEVTKWTSRIAWSKEKIRK